MINVILKNFFGKNEINFSAIYCTFLQQTTGRFKQNERSFKITLFY